MNDESASSARFFAYANSMLKFLEWPLERILVMVPVWLGIASLVIFFFLVRMLLSASFPAVLATLVLAIHPLFFASHAAGHARHVAPAFFLVLASVFVFISLMKVRGKALLALFAVFVLVQWLLSKVWQGWHAVLLLIVLFVLALGIIAAVRACIRKSKYAWLRLVGMLGIILLATWGFISFGISGGIIPAAQLGESPSITSLLGIFLSLFAISAAIALLFRIFKQKASSIDVFLIVWALAAIALGSVAPVLAVHALLPFLVLVAYAAEGIAQRAQKIVGWLGEQHTPLIARFIGCMAIGLIVIGSVWAPGRAAVFELPVANDAIAETGKLIALNSTQNAMIAAWSDKSLLLQVFARRQAVADGNDQLEMAELAQALVTSNESLAKTILQGLACKNEEECKLPLLFVIVSEQQLSQLPIIEVIAKGDFSEPNFDRVLPVSQCSPGRIIMNCNDYLLNLTSLEAVSGGKHPAAVYVYGSQGRRSRVFEDAATQYALVAYEDTGRYRSFLVDNELAESMFVRMVARDQGLRYFEPFFLTRQPERIVTFAISWNGRRLTRQNIAPANTSATEISSVLAAGLKD